MPSRCKKSKEWRKKCCRKFKVGDMLFNSVADAGDYFGVNFQNIIYQMKALGTFRGRKVEYVGEYLNKRHCGYPDGRRKVSVDGKVYESLSAAANGLGTVPQLLRYYLKKKNGDYKGHKVEYVKEN